MSQYSPYPRPDQPSPVYDAIPDQQQQESLGGWILAVLLTLIPIVNIIYLLVLAFGTGPSVAKRNFAWATLIWMAVGIVLSIVLAILLAAAGLSVFSELANMY
jgi:di/tricarboxylate transporter